MPGVFNKKKVWTRGGYLDQKRHIDMTEEEKITVFRCDGVKSEHPCKNPVFRCKECGNYGCSQEVLDKCSQQGFKNDKCLQCGTVASRIPIMEDEYKNVVEKWRLSDV